MLLDNSSRPADLESNMRLMETRPTHILVRLALSLMALLAASVHDSSIAQAGCSLVDEQRPAQFIEYAGVSESFGAVKLRLRNNSDCTIIVRTDDHFPNRIVRQPDRGVRLEAVTDSQDGVVLGLHYLLHHRRRQTLKAGYGWGDSVFTYKILAGQSVFFNVPLSTFRKWLDIAVPFNYSWEGGVVGMGAGGTVHRVYFLFDDLPKNVLRTAGSNHTFNRNRS
jgi:hypothetical protein